MNLGRSVAEAMLEREARPLGTLRTFNGAGIYALYYVGEFPPYDEIARANRDGQFRWPIYVGKAVPPGARKGNFGIQQATGPDLFKRLSEHRDTILAASNLSIGDFFCRFVVVDDIWIPLGEALLIARFRPLWNRLVDGFGNHDPGSGRYSGMMPRWDVLHPGRAWAARCEPRHESARQIAAEVIAYLRTAPEPTAHMLGPGVVDLG
jgi:hypothetical protein